MAGTASERLTQVEREGLKPDGTWNRRVIRHANGDLAIHEVHYDGRGNVVAWSEDFSEAVDAEEGVEGLIAGVEFTYKTSMEAAATPVMDVPDLPGALVQ